MRRWAWWTAIGILVAVLAGLGAWRIKLELPDQLRRIENALRDEAARYGIGVSWRSLRFHPFYLSITFDDVRLRDTIANLPLGSARTVDVSLSPRLLLFGESPVSKIRVRGFTFRFGEADLPILDRIRAAPSGGGTLPDILLFEGTTQVGPFGKLEQVRMRIPSARIRHVRFFGTRVTFAVDNVSAAVEYPVVGPGAWPFPSLSGDLLIKEKIVSVRRFRADGPSASLKGAGSIDLARVKNDLKISGAVDMARWIAIDAPGARWIARFVHEGKGEFSASLKGALSDPSGAVKASLRNGRFEGLDAADFELSAALKERQLRIGGLKGTLWRGSLTATGSYDIPKRQGTLTASLERASLKAIPWPAAAGGWRPSGLGNLTVAASGNLDSLAGSIGLAVPEGFERAVPGTGQERIRMPLLASLAGKVNIASKRADIGTARIQLGRTDFTAAGTVDWGRRRLSASGSASSPFGRTADYGIREPVSWRRLAGQWSLDGDFAAPEIKAQLSAEAIGVSAFQQVPVSAKVEGNLADVVHFVADVPSDLAKATATGTVTGPLAHKPLQLDAAVTARDIDFSKLSGWIASASSPPEVDTAAAARYLETLAGRGSAEIELAYSDVEKTVTGSVHSGSVSLRGVTVQSVSAEGNWRGGPRGGHWQGAASGDIAGGRIQVGGAGEGMRAEIKGTADRIEIARVAALLPGRQLDGIQGAVSIDLLARVDAGGRFELPDVRLSISDLVAAGVSWGRVTGNGKLGAETGSFGFASESPALRLTGGISRGQGIPVTFRLSGAQLPTSLFASMAGKSSLPAEGKWDFEADGQLKASELAGGIRSVPSATSAFHFRLSGTSPSVSEVGFESVLAEGRKEGDALVGEIRTGAPDGRLACKVGLQGPYPFHAEGPFSFGNRKSVGKEEMRNPFSMSGRVELTGTLQSFDKTTGSIQVDQLRYKQGGIDLFGKGLTAKLGADGIRWSGGTVVASGNPISVSGKVSWKGEMDARVEGKMPAAMVRLATDIFDRLDGTVTMNIRVTGKLDNPNIVGTGHLEGGVFSFKGYGQLFEEMKADAIISREKIVFEHFDGRSGGGFLDGRGELPLQFDAGQRMFFSVDFLDMRYPYPDDFRPVLQGHAELIGPVENLLVTGDIEIQSARYTRTIRPQKLMLDFKRRLADVTARRQKDEFRVRLDINVVADGTLEIRNNLATATAKGEFKVVGDTSRIIVLGAFDVLEGKIEFQGDAYDVKHLSIDFNDPRRNNPRIDGRAEVKKNNYLVTILVTGTLDKYEVDLASDPPLSKNDIVSLLSLGVTSQSLAGQEGSVGASLGASIALGPYKGRVEEGIRNLVGLDKLALEAAFSSATKSFEPRFVVGKTFGERITVSVSTLVGATSDSSASVEFKLLENVFLQGAWQSATTQKTGDLGADIKFKYRYRTFSDFLGGRD